MSWWRQLQAAGQALDPASKTGWRHPRPGRFVHWETLFELFDPNWIELAHDRDQWRHSRYRFVLGELARLSARSTFGFGARPSPSASIDVAPSALVPARQPSRPWPPASLLGVPSTRGTALLSSSEICRLPSLLPGASVKRSGPCSQVLAIMLGSLHTRDTTVLSLAPRLMRLFVALAQATSSRPDLLLGLSPGGFRPCLTLARAAAESWETFECFLPLEVSLSDLPPWQIFVYHGRLRWRRSCWCWRVLLSCGWLTGFRDLSISIIPRSYVYGFICRVAGANLALLIALSFLTWVAHCPRSAPVP